MLEPIIGSIVLSQYSQGLRLVELNFSLNVLLETDRMEVLVVHHGIW